MSDFNNPLTHDIQAFTALMEAFIDYGDQQEGNGSPIPQIAFEDTLCYVVLPNFTTSPECPFQSMILPFLRLLRKRGVRKIFTLIVQDSLSKPTSEADILVVLNMFDIECLNWRRLDIDLEVFRDNHGFKQLRELYLYSSGNWASLYHWGMDDILHHEDNRVGRPCLEKIETCV